MTIAAGSQILASDFVSSSSGAGDSGKSPVLGSTGKLAVGFIPAVKFGGTGADGALSITSGTTTIDCANAAVVVKNYTSLSITGTGKLAFSNPHTNGTIVIIKVQGNVTLTSSQAPMIDMSLMGAAGGVGPTSTAGNVGNSSATWNDQVIPGGTAGSGAGAGGGGGGGASMFTSATGATAPCATSQFNTIETKVIKLAAGAGGGSGGGQAGGFGGTGGRGGGGLYIECGGALNFTTASGISVAGGVGAASPGGSGGGGGGGGAGGIFIMLYNTLTANSGTVTVTAGGGGAGAGGGAAGATGAVGLSTIAANTIFA